MKPINLILLIIPLSACTFSEGHKDFALPEGNAATGRKVFEKFECQNCHILNSEKDAAKSTKIILGGPLLSQKTYVELVTSIINPSHRISHTYLQKFPDQTDSPMKVYNDVMTVGELTDLVTFLRLEFQVVEWEPSDYRTYEYKSRNWKLPEL